MEKPPLGIKPLSVFLDEAIAQERAGRPAIQIVNERHEQIKAAAARFKAHGKEPPDIWIAEELYYHTHFNELY